ncbi:hypothetical protein JW905_14265 [bacterium]|nr:hypothetical protein [candidate division CSSED10-310 bacterium]
MRGRRRGNRHGIPVPRHGCGPELAPRRRVRDRPPPPWPVLTDEAFLRPLARSSLTLVLLVFINMLFTPGLPWVVIPFIGILKRNVDRYFTVRRRLEVSSPAASGPPRAARAFPAPSAAERQLKEPYAGYVREATGLSAEILRVTTELNEEDRAFLGETEERIKTFLTAVERFSKRADEIEQAIAPYNENILDARIGDLTTRPAEDLTDLEAANLRLLRDQRRNVTKVKESVARIKNNISGTLLAMRNVHLELLRLASTAAGCGSSELAGVKASIAELSADVDALLQVSEMTQPLLEDYQRGLSGTGGSS